MNHEDSCAQSRRLKTELKAKDAEISRLKEERKRILDALGLMNIGSFESNVMARVERVEDENNCLKALVDRLEKELKVQCKTCRQNVAQRELLKFCILDPMKKRDVFFVNPSEMLIATDKEVKVKP